MPVDPPPAVLGTLGVEVARPLAGRVNRHWLVRDRAGRPAVLRRWAGRRDEIDYELRLVADVAALGWPVPEALGEPVDVEGWTWSLARVLPGDPPADGHGDARSRRGRGRLLAALHVDLARAPDRGQRPGMRCAHQVLADPRADQLLSAAEVAEPERIGIVRRHLDRARELAAGLPLDTAARAVVHGDFTPWNLLYRAGRLSGLLDFELAHRDVRVAEFALAWRGVYDDVVHGYEEVAPLDAWERAALTPLWWAHLVEGACTDLREGRPVGDWTVAKLLVRSPLMGPDAG